MSRALLKASVGRRGFLRTMLAAPAAAKAVSDRAIAEAVGLNPIGLGGYGPSPPGGAPLAANAGALSTSGRVSRLFKFLKKSGGLPRFELEKIRRECRYVHTLDPDLAALRSFSMSVKIQMQRERNIERTIEQTLAYQTYAAAMESFRERHGFWLWW